MKECKNVYASVDINMTNVDEEDKLNNETLSSLGQRGGWVISATVSKMEIV